MLFKEQQNPNSQNEEFIVFGIQLKLTSHAKKQRNVTYHQDGTAKSMKTDLNMSKSLELIKEYLKSYYKYV